MSKIYAVGDIQGCAPSLKTLVKNLPKKSKIIFLGDLVNRGPDSLGALRQLKSLQESGRAECILGNHDLHLLAIDAGLRKTKGLDTVESILKAPDRAELIHWIRNRPMALSDGNVLTVHAGVLPQWDLQQTIECAQEVEKSSIIADIIKPICVVTVTPEFVDVDYNYINVYAKVFYNPTKTSLSPDGIRTIARNAIISYKTTDLNTFNSKFRHHLRQLTYPCQLVSYLILLLSHLLL